MSFFLKWVSYRQHMCMSCFLIHSAILCLLIGAFDPFTFKVIIDRFIFIAIFPICTCVPLCLTLFLPLLTAVLYYILQRWHGGSVFFSPFWSGKLLILPSFLMRAFLGRVVSVSGLCFLLLGIFLPFSPGLQCFC